MGICALCRNDAPLIRSHLMPRSAYKAARSSGELVRIDTAGKSAFFSDEQVVMNLLCAHCEDLFSKNGEKIIGNYWSTDSGFRLRDLIVGQGALASGARFSVYDSLSIDSTVRNALLYFAISIYWRASVWDWGRVGNRYFGALGPKYEEIFRQYLLGVQELQNSYLLVTVNTTDHLNGLLAFPSFGKVKMATLHKFEMLGLRFALIVGGSIPDELKRPFVGQGSNLVLISSPLDQAPDFIELSTFISCKVIPRGRLSKEPKPFG